MTDFPETTIAAVLHHMNDDHRDDNQLIVRAFADETATDAVMTTLDNTGGTWTFNLGAETREVTVPWSEHISERAEIRREIVKLYDAACERLGVEPRPHE